MLKTIDLISPAYADEQRRLHAEALYGHRGYKWATVVADVAQTHDCWSILDYGCGRGTLKPALDDITRDGTRVSEYDPAIKGKDAPPSFADLVVCTDVLEHIEPERLDAVLRHLRMLARKAIFVVVATVDTAHTLSDGRSTHLTIASGEWWYGRLSMIGFTILPPPASARTHDKEWIGVLLP